MKRILMIMLCLALCAAGHAQDLKQAQSILESQIRTAHRKVRLSDRDLEKLLKEQEAIKKAIAKAEEDGVWSDKERSAIQEKLDRAEKNFRRRKVKGEEY